jgi:putative transposase
LRPGSEAPWFKKTTDSEHNGRIAANLLAQDFSATAPDQKWAADISYIWTAEGWLYLALVIDLFSRRIIGWAMSGRMEKGLAVTALRKALAMRQRNSGWRR